MGYKIVISEKDGKVVLRYQLNDTFGTFTEEIYDKKHDMEAIGRAIGVKLQLNTLVSE